MTREELGEQLSAYIDGELGDAEAARVERILETDGNARQLLDDLRQTSHSVSSLPRQQAPESILADLRHRLERSELLSDEDAPGEVSDMRGASSVMRWGMAAAFGLAVIGGTWVVLDQYGTRQAQPESVVTIHDTADFAAERHESESDLRNEGMTALSGNARRRARSARDSDAAIRITPEHATVRSGDRVAYGTSFDNETYESLLNVQQKLDADLPFEAIQSTNFSNELLRLEVRVPDEKTRDRLASRVVSNLVQQRLVDLETCRDSQVPARFYQTGRLEVNFLATGHKQLLVRASASQIDGILSELESGESSEQQIEMVMNDFRFRGNDQARHLIRSLGARLDTAPPTEARKQSASGQDELVVDGRGPFNGLTEIFGLNGPSIAIAQTQAKDDAWLDDQDRTDTPNSATDQEGLGERDRLVKSKGRKAGQTEAIDSTKEAAAAPSPQTESDRVAGKAGAENERHEPKRKSERRDDRAQPAYSPRKHQTPGTPAVQDKSSPRPSLVQRRRSAALDRTRGGSLDRDEKSETTRDRTVDRHLSTSGPESTADEPLITIVLDLIAEDIARPKPVPKYKVNAKTKKPKPNVKSRVQTPGSKAKQ